METHPGVTERSRPHLEPGDWGPPPPDHEAHLDHAARLARRGPRFDDNPRVGCVLVGADGFVLATGYHRGAGTPHAEADALARARASGLDTRGATAYVTLEPCNHEGRTPSCARALIAARVGLVVFAHYDPNPLAARGGETLRSAGIPATRVAHAESSSLLDEWLVQRAGRPWVTLKIASSLDGRVAAADGTSQWITGARARADAHLRRSRHDAIAVGMGTVLADDPALTARDADGGLLDSQPRPVIFGRRAIPVDARVRQHPLPLLHLPGTHLAADLFTLHRQGVRGLFVEGGAQLATSLLAQGLVDEVLIYAAPVLLGGPRSWLGDARVPTLAAAPRLQFHEILPLGKDVLLRARPAQTSAAWAPTTDAPHKEDPCSPV
ncbi:bifunctional diaminohydroxyphosphoribosylaminopyrimidine deaminase/5-amino-6-(5-phosphoribosylamino)uracil reductase RibD [Micrococcales bacterium 31B]|nr:bifunctional diaminohydroxyphosphoribosylaminopyrimidine deaminase/5-amino-6-(5-phosphoribosylamino)uracil reductase RibD [Micrococcales bacterium 31B]